MVKVDAKVKGGSGIYNNGYLMEGGGVVCMHPSRGRLHSATKVGLHGNRITDVRLCNGTAVHDFVWSLEERRES